VDYSATVSIFGLVHGAWHGSWCWDLVVAELRQRGHEAVAVDLPTQDPTAGAEVYADVVVRHLDPYGDDLVLVGHSFGGLTLPLVADRRPVGRMVLVAPLLPEPGFSFDDLCTLDPDTFMPGLRAGQVAHADGSTEWEAGPAIATLYPDAPPNLASWAAERLRPQQWRLTRETTPLRTWPDCPTRVIACAGDAVVNPEWLRRSVRLRLGIGAEVIAGDHSPFLTRPVELVDALLA
jgi:pimeloyl-ACP methyl ester carboxylesterase